MITLSPIQVDPSVFAANNYWQQVVREYGRLQSLLNQGGTLVWNNPYGLAPQQAINLFGTNGVALIQLSSLLCNLLGAIGSTTPNPVPAGWSVTPNADGTVTLTSPTST
jgi:hypothetical protein